MTGRLKVSLCDQLPRIFYVPTEYSSFFSYYDLYPFPSLVSFPVFSSSALSYFLHYSSASS